jgi:hypothetical protein
MIPLDSWALSQKTDHEGSSRTEPIANLDAIADLIADLQENVLLASRHAQGKIMQAEQAQNFGSLAKQIAKTQFELIADLRADLDRQLAALFLPLLEERVEAKAVKDFCQSLGRAVEKDSIRQLVISAPIELQTCIAHHLAETDVEISFEDNAIGEISASNGGTEIVTELLKWKMELYQELSP